MATKKRSRPAKKKSGREFVSTEVKDYVRSVFDRGVIEKFKIAHFPKEDLAFLGLPGEQLLDILSWREFFSRWTAVQVAESEEDSEIADELERRILRNNLESNCQFLRANIDELLVAPASSTRLKWPYHVVNLDYYGGLVNAKGDGSAERLEALKSLFSHQAGVSFVLLLTLSLRGDDGGELEKLVQKEEDDFAGLELTGVEESFARHREEGRPGLLKLYVPLFLAGTAPRHRLVFHQILRYAGTIPMMHFAIECIPYSETQASHQLSTTERLALINRPLSSMDRPGEVELIEFPQIM